MPAQRKLQNKKLNFLIVAALFVIFIGVYAASAILSGTSGTYAVVHDGEGGVTVLKMDQASAESQTKSITTSLGTNVVEVSESGVQVIEADCANQDCVRQGTINSSSSQIVCLPHKLWIEVVSAQNADAAKSGTSSASVEDVAEGIDVVSR